MVNNSRNEILREGIVIADDCRMR